jgi:hypothetical protein
MVIGRKLPICDATRFTRFSKAKRFWQEYPPSTNDIKASAEIFDAYESGSEADRLDCDGLQPVRLKLPG